MGPETPEAANGATSRTPTPRVRASRISLPTISYDTGDTFDQSMARGFIELWGMSAKVASGRDIRVAGK